MKIETIAIESPGDAGQEQDDEVVMFIVSGPFNEKDEVLARSREMVVKTGSNAMIESFDWALESGALLAQK